MKSLFNPLLLLLAFLFYSFGTDSSTDNDFYLHPNGVTIMCPNTQPGDIGVVNGVEYESVNNTLLRSHIDRGSDLSKVCVSLIDNIEDLFDGADSKMFGQSIGNWDVSNMTTMRNWFRNSAYNQDISHWDVSNVVDMSGMFYGSNFNHSLEEWDVSNVVVMTYMFRRSLFNQPIEKWEVGSVIDMQGMFDVSLFNQPLEKWDVSNVESMNFMFSNSPFNQPIGNWDVSNVIRMNYMFNESSFNQSITTWCVEQITSEPEFFSTGSPLEEENKPIWGQCPEE